MNFQTKPNHIIFLLFLFFISSNGLLSQKNLEKVTIEFVDGSSKKGLIEFKDPLSNFSTLKYYKSKSSKVEKINSSEIKSMTLKNITYFGANVEVESSSDRKNQLDSEKTPKLRKDYGLILPIIEGQKSLYFYKDIDKKDHFFIKEDGVITTLIYKKYADYFGPVIRMKENRTYIGQLSKYLYTDDWLVDFTSYTYDIGKLKELFLFYYRVNGIDPDFIYE